MPDADDRPIDHPTPPEPRPYIPCPIGPRTVTEPERLAAAETGLPA